MSQLLLVFGVAILTVNLVLLAMVPFLVDKVIRRELRRLFEGEYDG